MIIKVQITLFSIFIFSIVILDFKSNFIKYYFSDYCLLRATFTLFYKIVLL